MQSLEEKLEILRALRARGLSEDAEEVILAILPDPAYVILSDGQIDLATRHPEM